MPYNVSGFGTGRCGVCEAGIRELDAFCSDQCEVEAERRMMARDERRAWLEGLECDLGDERWAA